MDNGRWSIDTAFSGTGYRLWTMDYRLMNEVAVKRDQSLFDVALQEYGDIEGVFWLVQDNPALMGITDTLRDEQVLKVRLRTLGLQIQRFLKGQDLATARGALGEGIGYWAIGQDFIVKSEKLKVKSEK